MPVYACRPRPTASSHNAMVVCLCTFLYFLVILVPEGSHALPPPPPPVPQTTPPPPQELACMQAQAQCTITQWQPSLSRGAAFQARQRLPGGKPGGSRAPPSIQSRQARPQPPKPPRLAPPTPPVLCDAAHELVCNKGALSLLLLLAV